ncbi:MAG: hypothetical protein QME58_07500 [Bacteroidota bacterium]|nr:hypothetical protein [Bacteroidota bacterium]
MQKSFTFPLAHPDSSYQLEDRYIIKETMDVYVESTQLLLGKDYIWDFQNNKLKLLAETFEKINKNADDKLFVSYKIYPLTFKEKYYRRALITRNDSLRGKLVQSIESASAFSIENIFSKELQANGSLTRGFTVGSNRDMSLNSGFRMQMSGKLSEGVDVVAALTDENTPIQPEGNTQTLQEIDKIFIELKTKNLSTTLGDFNISYDGNEFSRINRKLQGGMGTAKYDAGFSNGNIVMSGAVTKGKFNTNQFIGIEGVQGPYRLLGKNRERAIIIIAGSERVYVDGELMKRGDNNDYIIDYALAELTFSSKKLVHGNSRIVVDFEYTDRQYTRNFISGKNSSNFLRNKISLATTFIREGDDYDNPIDLSLSENDKAILRNAGDDRFAAVQDGANFIGSGKGQYIRVDTIIQAHPKHIFRYSPGDSAAHYSVNFSYVGEGRGEYAKISIGNFNFVGEGLGSYMPIRFLPLPQIQTIFDVDIKSAVTDELKLTGEAALSSFDANRFSKINDVDNRGGAYKFSLQYNPKELKFGGLNFGRFDFKILERIVTSQFQSIDRMSDVEFDRKWNLIQSAKTNEEITEGSLIYNPINEFAIGTGYGRMRRGDLFTSDRLEGNISLSKVSMPQFQYKIESINSEDKYIDSRSNWLRQIGGVEFSKSNFTTNFKYENEIRKAFSMQTDTLKVGSFSFQEYSPKILLRNILNSLFSVEYKWRVDNLFSRKQIRKESNTLTQIYSAALRPISNLSANVDVTYRKRIYTEEFKSQAGGNTETILLRWFTRYAALNRGIETDLLYDVSTQKSAKLERVFQRVDKGSGSYMYIGDIDSNGIATEDEFRPTRFDGDYISLTIPSDKLTPVVDLKANWRLKLVPAKFISNETLAGRVSNMISLETFLRIEEKSTIPDQRKIYLLNLNSFLSDSFTISGNRGITQDINILENDPAFSIRLRYQERKGLIQYAAATERSFNRDRSVRLRWQLVKEISNQIDYENKINQVIASQENYRVRNIGSNFVISDWMYRPEPRFEFGFKIGLGKAENKSTTHITTADINTQGMRIIYSIKDRGLARFEFNREEVQIIGATQNIPFELTAGRVLGKTWLWRLAVEYRVTSFIQTSIYYDGRKEANLKTNHQMRGEVRAFF